MSLQLNNENNINKTHKSSKQETSKNKLKETSNKKLWTIFDQEYKEDTDIECVYTKEKNMLVNDNICANCTSSLFIGEDGFLTCSNICCGLIFKDNFNYFIFNNFKINCIKNFIFIYQIRVSRANM